MVGTELRGSDAWLSDWMGEARSSKVSCTWWDVRSQRGLKQEAYLGRTTGTRGIRLGNKIQGQTNTETHIGKSGDRNLMQIKWFERGFQTYLFR